MLARLITMTRNSIRGLLQAHGAKLIKQRLWNREFSKGQWVDLQSSPGDFVYKYIEKYANKGSILDLGCGLGNTSVELETNAYTNYIGVDISDVALEQAKKKASDSARSKKNEYIQCDICDYVPNGQFDVILFRDSIYYVPMRRIKAMLDRYSQYLKQHGVFIVRMWSVSGSYKSILDMIDSRFQAVERGMLPNSDSAVVVFRKERKVQP